MLKEFDYIKNEKEYHDQKDVLLGGTLLSKKEKRSARGNNYAFLNFSDLTSIYELIIFESTLRKYRDILIEGDSFVLGVDFSNNNGTLRGELKRVFKFDELKKINFDGNYSMRENLSEQKTVKIYTDADFSKNELSKLKWVKGKNRVEIIINNQLLKLPGYFEVSSQMIDKMKNLKGVTKVDLI